MNISIKKTFVLSILLLISNLFALEKVGTTSFQFLKVTTDARSTAMGEAYSAIANTSDALFWNPARITKVEGMDFTASYMDYYLDVSHMSFSAAFSIGQYGTLGLMGVVTDLGDFYETRVDHLGFIGDKYNPGLTGNIIHPGSFVFGLSFARDMTENFSFGVTAKYGHEDLVEKSAGTLMFDVGLNYTTGYKSIEIAAAMRHFGPQVKFYKRSYPLPQTMVIGVSGYLMDRNDFLFLNSEQQSVLFAFDIIQPRDYDQQYNVGFEWAYDKMYFLRAGYKINYDSEGLAFGAGLNYENYRIDYSFNDSGEYLDSVQRFTLGVSF